MGRKKETDEVKVKRVYPDAEYVEMVYSELGGINENVGYSIGTTYLCLSELQDTPDLAWSDALKQINAAKRKKYYKRKITRPNNEKKGKVNIMLYPSDKTAIIGKYGSVQKFINHSVEQLKTK